MTPHFMAHHGGFDLLYLVAPVAAVLGWIWWAERRWRRAKGGGAGSAPPIIPGDPDKDHGA